MTLVFRVMRPIDRIYLSLSQTPEHTFVNRQFMERSRGHSAKETLYTTMITVKSFSSERKALPFRCFMSVLSSWNPALFHSKDQPNEQRFPLSLRGRALTSFPVSSLPSVIYHVSTDKGRLNFVAAINNRWKILWTLFCPRMGLYIDNLSAEEMNI